MCTNRRTFSGLPKTCSCRIRGGEVYRSREEWVKLFVVLLSWVPKLLWWWSKPWPLSESLGRSENPNSNEDCGVVVFEVTLMTFRMLGSEQDIEGWAFLLIVYHSALPIPAVLFPVFDFYTLSPSPVWLFSALPCNFLLPFLIFTLPFQHTFSFQHIFLLCFPHFLFPVLYFQYLSPSHAVTITVMCKFLYQVII